MTNDDLLKRAKEAKERAEKATPGPWQQDGSHIYGPDPQRYLLLQMHYVGRGYQEECAANEQLILNARSDIPFLAEAVERLSADNERLKALGRGLLDGLEHVHLATYSVYPAMQEAAFRAALEDQHNG